MNAKEIIEWIKKQKIDTDAFSVNEGWCRRECLKSIAVRKMCEAGIVEV